MPYNHVQIYHYSGTGNSYRVAKWLDQAVQDNGVDSTLLAHQQPLSRRR